MFKIQDINPEEYRYSTRNATLRIMGLFIVVGFITSYVFSHSFGANPPNLLTLQIIGALIGLGLVFLITAKVFKNQYWMQEAMYGWQLKRSLMHITNVIELLQKKVADGDVEAMKIMRFYHLGISQMYTFEQNTSGLIDLKAEKEQLETKMRELELDTAQFTFELSNLKQVVGELKPAVKAAQKPTANTEKQAKQAKKSTADKAKHKNKSEAKTEVKTDVKSEEGSDAKTDDKVDVINEASPEKTPQ